jgi:hypothetical protein
MIRVPACHLERQPLTAKPPGMRSRLLTCRLDIVLNHRVASYPNLLHLPVLYNVLVGGQAWLQQVRPGASPSRDSSADALEKIETSFQYVARGAIFYIPQLPNYFRADERFRWVAGVR